MGFSKSLATGRATASVVDGLVVPLSVPDDRLPPIVLGHGAGQDASALMSEGGASRTDLWHRLANMGYVLACPTVGALWGNSTSDGLVTDAIAFARANGAHPSKRSIFIGLSMGAATALKYAADHPERVGLVITMIPALDWDYLIANDTLGLRAQINVAWGRASGDTSTLAGGINPTTLTTPLAKVRQQHWYATDDACSTNIGTYSTTVGADLRSVGALGHSGLAIVAANGDEIIRTIESHHPQGVG